MRRLAPPSDGDVVCTRRPLVSLSIMLMSPGVISIFSSISSRASTSTRTGSSSIRRPVRVDSTTIPSSSMAASRSSIARVVSTPARTSTVPVAGA